MKSVDKLRKCTGVCKTHIDNVYVKTSQQKENKNGVLQTLGNDMRKEMLYGKYNG